MTDTALPAVVIASVLKLVGVPGVGATISVAVAVCGVAMVSCPGGAGFLIMLVRLVRLVRLPCMVAAWVVFFVVAGLVGVPAVVVVPVVVAVRAGVFAPAPITRPVMLPLPALTNAPERRTKVSSRSAGAAMHRGYIPQQLRGDVLASNVEIHKSIDDHPISHLGVPSS